MGNRVHVIGAGVSGLAAAVKLAKAGFTPIVYEAGPQAGGRCRSYFDSHLGCRIDNGNHLLLSGNRDVMAYLDTIGARDTLTGPTEPVFPFIDLASMARWELRPSLGKMPRWIFSAADRVPGSRWLDYLAPLKLAYAGSNATVTSVLNKDSALYRRLWEPLGIAALNTPLDEASAALFWTIIRETLGAGGEACRPLVPKQGLSETLVDPAIAYVNAKGGAVHLNKRVHKLIFDDAHVSALDFGDTKDTIEKDEAVVLAVPAPVALDLIPGLVAPGQHQAIVNVHYRVRAPKPGADFIGIVGGVAEWAFIKGDILSVTISAANRVVSDSADDVILNVWNDLKRIFDLTDELPPARVVKEKRATFAATPAQERLRPGPKTAWKNLLLAGDWTATGLPATIEGSVRSGHIAAQLIVNKA